MLVGAGAGFLRQLQHPASPLLFLCRPLLLWVLLLLLLLLGHVKVYIGAGGAHSHGICAWIPAVSLLCWGLYTQAAAGVLLAHMDLAW